MEILFGSAIVLVLLMWTLLFVGRKKKGRIWSVAGLISGGLGVVLALTGLVVSCLPLIH